MPREAVTGDGECLLPCFACKATATDRHTRGEKGFAKQHRTEPSSPRALTLQGGGAMDGGGAASPDAAICISPGAGPIVAVAPAGIRVENCYVFKMDGERLKS